MVQLVQIIVKRNIKVIEMTKQNEKDKNSGQII